MKIFILIALLFVCGCNRDQPKQSWPWPIEGVANVKFFLINPDEPSSFTPLVLADGTLNATRIPNEGVSLSNEQQLAVREALLRERPPYPKAMCFYPHHSFLLLGSDGERLGSIDVCFQCLQHSGIEGLAQYIDFSVLAHTVEQLGYPIDVSEPDSDPNDPFGSEFDIDEIFADEAESKPE